MWFIIEYSLSNKIDIICVIEEKQFNTFPFFITSILIQLYTYNVFTRHEYDGYNSKKQNRTLVFSFIIINQ